MVRSIILLTGEREVPFFKEFLWERDSSLNIMAAHTRSELIDAVDKTGGNARLISYVTDVIVPRHILSRLVLTPYNIHPGPPEFPGSHADSFAIWEGSNTYGVTAHEIAPLVDSGPIVAVCRFPMPALATRLELADLAYSKAVEVFAVVAAHCADCDDPMPRMLDEHWSNVKTTKAQFRDLCSSLSKVPTDALDRLQRACGPDLVSA